MNERDDCIVLDCALQYLCQLGVIDRIKEAFEGTDKEVDDVCDSEH